VKDLIGSPGPVTRPAAADDPYLAPHRFGGLTVKRVPDAMKERCLRSS
jgi:hypothetical protein